MKKRYLLVLTAVFALLLPLHAAKKVKQQTQSDREYWCSLAYKMAQPVLENMAKGELQKNMKTEFSSSPGSPCPTTVRPRASSASSSANGHSSRIRTPLTLHRPTTSAGARLDRTSWMPPTSPSRSSVAGTPSGYHSMK